MSIMWNGSLIAWIDENGDPYAGAKAYFFDAGTTTPMVTYTEASLSIPHDHPVVANSAGMFPAIFLVEQATYRLRITDVDGVTIHDVDFISAPTTVIPDPPSGDTPVEYLYQTGDIKIAWRTSAPTGYVRLNGRTIGNPLSGATERANADCEALFGFLWEQDPNLVVSGGRGATWIGDWAAAKTITLPDFRDRAPVGMGGMGNTKSTLIADGQTDDGDTDVLGATGGEGKHPLILAELAAHSHTGTALSAGNHTHSANTKPGPGNGGAYLTRVESEGVVSAINSINSAGAHIHTLSINNTGSGVAHNNVQPSLFVPFFIKL